MRKAEPRTGQQQSSQLGRAAQLTLTALAGATLTLAVFFVLLRIQQQSAGSEFQSAVHRRTEALRQTVADKLSTVNAIVAFFDSSVRVERDEFTTCTSEFLRGSPEFQALAWVPRVRHSKRHEHEVAARREGVERFQIVDLHPGENPVRAARRLEYLPVYYIEPFTTNESLMGRDLALEPTWERLLRAACEQKQIKLTPPLRLDPASDAKTVCLAFAPVYEQQGVDYTTDGRRNNLQGFVVAVLPCADLISRALEPFDSSMISIQVTDITKRNFRATVYPPQVDDEDQALHASTSARDSKGALLSAQEALLSMGGRTWSVEYRPTQSFIGKHHSWAPWLSLGIGFAFTALLTFHLKTHIDRAKNIEEVVRERTTELAAEMNGRKRKEGQLRESNSRLESLNQQLDSTARDLKILMSNVVQANALESRFRNGALVPCWEHQNCEHRQCPAYLQTDNRRCWEINGTFCEKHFDDGPIEPAQLCRGCEVYQRARNTPINDLGETFNEMVLALEHRQSALETARFDAESANRAKSEFLANMSHEIRTPMTALLGYVDILSETCESPESREAVAVIKRNGKHLLSIINDILDLSKIEAGKLQVEQLRCRPAHILAEVVTLMRGRAEEKGLRFQVRYDGPVARFIRSDPTRLRQVLINLVGNAIKFTETGAVYVDVRVVERPDESPVMQFDVIDTGVGITEEQIAALFVPFSQADTSTTRKYGGSGLGLALSRRLAQILGGDISVESAPGEGSTFTVTISTGSLDDLVLVDNPNEGMSHQDHNKAKDASRIELGCRVLLAEDGPDNQRLFSLILRRAGADVTLAENGQIACDLALAAMEQGTPYDVILMDMQMPELGGLAATRKLREEDYIDPIIALTANAMSDDRAKCLDAGCDDYVAKPISRDELIAAVARWTHAGHQSAFTNSDSHA